MEKPESEVAKTIKSQSSAFSHIKMPPPTEVMMSLHLVRYFFLAQTSFIISFI